jgi:hypothetical protein
MDLHKRRHLVDELLRLPRSELDSIVTEVQRHETTQEAGARVLGEALAQRAAQSQFSPLSISPEESDE